MPSNKIYTHTTDDLANTADTADKSGVDLAEAGLNESYINTTEYGVHLLR